MAYKSFQPWVGKHYRETRLLLLGESAYSWRDETNKLCHPTPDLPTEIIREILDLDNFGSVNYNMRFMKMLSRALAGEEEPSKERLCHVWQRVAFTNYVGGTTGEGPGNRPTREMWEAAKRAFHPDILNELRPRRIIVLGKVMWSKMPEVAYEDMYMTDDVQGYLLEDGSVAVCWVLPGRGLSWIRLADIIHFTLGPELPC